MTDEPNPQPTRIPPDEASPKVATPPAPVAAPVLAEPVAPPRLTQRLSDMTNNKCPNCALVNRVGVLVCENCGTSLLAGAASVPATRSLQDNRLGTGILFPERVPDRVLNDQKLPFIAPAPERKPPTGGESKAAFEEDMILRLEIDGASIPILVYPKKETLMGRRDVTTGTMPDVDLTSYAGYRMGVSRRHAMLKLQDKRLEMVDLGSSNGSMVNGVQMQPHHPFPLKDGDTLVLGKMTMRVIFQNGAQRVKRF